MINGFQATQTGSVVHVGTHKVCQGCGHVANAKRLSLNSSTPLGLAKIRSVKKIARPDAMNVLQARWRIRRKLIKRAWHVYKESKGVSCYQWCPRGR